MDIAIEAAWRSFLDASRRSAASRHGATGEPPAPFGVSMPIDWSAFYEFVVTAHELGAQLAYEDIERRLVAAGLSEGEAEDVAGAYWIGREVLTAYEKHHPRS